MAFSQGASPHAAWLLTPALALLLLPGCYYDNEEDLYPNSFCDTANIVYSGGIQEIIDGSCAIPGCHVPGGDGAGVGDFTDFADVSAVVANGTLLSAIKREANAIPMPPSTPLRECDVRRIELWIADGAQNN